MTFENVFKQIKNLNCNNIFTVFSFKYNISLETSVKNIIFFIILYIEETFIFCEAAL